MLSEKNVFPLTAKMKLLVANCNHIYECVSDTSLVYICGKFYLNGVDKPFDKGWDTLL